MSPCEVTRGLPKKYMGRATLVCFTLLLLQLCSVPQASAEWEQQPVWSYQTDGPVNRVAVSSDGSYTAATSYDGKVYLFNKSDNIPIWSYQVGDNAWKVAISSDGTYIMAASKYFVAGRDEHKVYMFSRFSSTPLWSFRTVGEFGDWTYWVSSISISSDGSYIAVGNFSGIGVRLFSKDSSTPLQSWEAYGITSVAISDNGDHIAAGSLYNKVYMFSRTSRDPLWSYTTKNEIWSVAISSDGSYIAAGGKDNTVYFFSSADNTLLWSYKTGGRVQSVSISLDGNYITAGAWDGKVYLFSKSDNTLIWAYQTTPPWIGSVAISSDGSYIVVAGNDRLYFFSRTSSDPLWCSEPYFYPEWVSISSDGNCIAVAGRSDNRVYLFSRQCGVVLTFRRLDGSPFENTEIYYGFSRDQVTNLLGTTDSQGKITTDNPDLAGHMVFFNTSDEQGKYSWTASISREGGKITPELTGIPSPGVSRPAPVFELLFALIIIVLATLGVIWAILIKRGK